MELRPGSHHSASETEYFYERLFPRIERLFPVKPSVPPQAEPSVLLREDSGFDSARLLFAKAAEWDRLANLGRAFDFICKWNPANRTRSPGWPRQRPPVPFWKRAQASGWPCLI